MIHHNKKTINRTTNPTVGKPYFLYEFHSRASPTNTYCALAWGILKETLLSFFGQSGPFIFETDPNPIGHLHDPLILTPVFHEGYTFSLRQTNVKSASHDAQTELVDCLILKENANAQHAARVNRVEVKLHSFTSALSRRLLGQ
jgi:hypothetical protein